MEILKGSIWQIVVGEMLTCGKVLALAPTGSQCVVWWWGARFLTAEVASACELRSGCVPTAPARDTYKLPAEINVILQYRSFKIGSFH